MSEAPDSSVSVSRSGMALCAACMTHFRLLESALVTTTCPFCETSLGVSSSMTPPQHGSVATARLRHSRSSLMLAALGVSLSLTACEHKSSEVIPSDAVAPVTAPDVQGSARPPSMRFDMGERAQADQGIDREDVSDMSDTSDGPADMPRDLSESVEVEPEKKRKEPARIKRKVIEDPPVVPHYGMTY